jgi:hypothetical protein
MSRADLTDAQAARLGALWLRDMALAFLAGWLIHGWLA